MGYKCNLCGVEWDYPVENCIFCNNTLSKTDNDQYIVEGLTQVFVPSADHPVTPYFVILLKDSNGSYKFHKTFQKYNIGDTILLPSNGEKRYTIGVIGTGITGKGIVEIAVKTGNKVILKSRNEESLEKALNVISRNLSKELEPDKLKVFLNKITPTTIYEPLTKANLIIESVVEDLEVKKNIFQKLDSICEPGIILASNTSTLPISKIAEGLKYPERVVGIHFFNPIPKMKLVELIKGNDTSEDTIKRAYEFASMLNKTTVNVLDISGFIVNRLLFLMINEACYMLEIGVARVEDIDKAMKMGANHPMGPFELADFIGIDLCLSILKILYNELKSNRYKPANVLQTMVNEGALGRKTGKGFYKYR